MKKQHILIVEDHAPLLAAIQHVLELEHYSVLTASDGVEALRVMEETRPDLIVADIMMPRMDGYDFYEAVRDRPEWVPIPFIFLTARAEKEDQLKGKALGVEDYIIKPFDPQELVIAVQARLGRAQAIQEATEIGFEQLKQQIINTLSHELRTPLTYIQGYTALALEDASSPGDLQEFLLAIKGGADRLTRLIEDMLLLVQMDTGQAMEDFGKLADTRPDIDTIVKSTVEKYVKQATQQGLNLEFQVTPNLPQVKLCKPFFVNALGRLLDNAIRFSRDKGKQVWISVRTSGEWVEVTVQDEGVGIAADQIPYLFERFRQIDREQMEQQGAGLGLAIAQELIALHGGEITADSKIGEGSTFTIRLPVAK
ncbi:MAG: response regulator [Anaerolineae bacterium]|nr:response regulator [Anaerolineae bacterium]